MGGENKTWKFRAMYVCAVLCVAGLMYLVEGNEFGNTPGLSNPFIRTAVCGGLCLFAYGYSLVSEQWLMKILAGLAQIIAALWSDWYQLGKIATDPSSEMLVRIVFMVAGVVVLAHGMSDIRKGLDDRRIDGSIAGPRRNRLPGAPKAVGSMNRFAKRTSRDASAETPTGAGSSKAKLANN